MGKAVALPPQIPGHVIILHTSIYVSVQYAKIGKYVEEMREIERFISKFVFLFKWSIPYKEPTEC